jgi:protoporphyrinogen IX oxidase
VLWVKAFHIIFMVTWFAGLFYLPRLFVYHAMSTDKPSIERFKVMERKLYYGITMPAMLATVVFGLWLLFGSGWAQPEVFRNAGWLHLKLILVAVLIGYHFYCGKLLKEFAADHNRHDHVWYRWFNELPVVLLMSIVLLAVVKPF